MLTQYFFSSYEFDILEDKGNYGHWEFNAVIYETMSFIPLLTNVNYANFVLKPTPNKDNYKIFGTYKTCFFKWACCKCIYFYISIPALNWPFNLNIL